eukprot:3474485-Lingulodinium_polyedra.AAC.1
MAGELLEKPDIGAPPGDRCFDVRPEQIWVIRARLLRLGVDGLVVPLEVRVSDELLARLPVRDVGLDLVGD